MIGEVTNKNDNGLREKSAYKTFNSSLHKIPLQIPISNPSSKSASGSETTPRPSKHLTRANCVRMTSILTHNRSYWRRDAASSTHSCLSVTAAANNAKNSQNPKKLRGPGEATGQWANNTAPSVPPTNQNSRNWPVHPSWRTCTTPSTTSDNNILTFLPRIEDFPINRKNAHHWIVLNRTQCACGGTSRHPRNGSSRGSASSNA
jgi:hypothetical protein